LGIGWSEREADHLPNCVAGFDNTCSFISAVHFVKWYLVKHRELIFMEKLQLSCKTLPHSYLMPVCPHVTTLGALTGLSVLSIDTRVLLKCVDTFQIW
jgi:hypothetical protein